jgi:hypothetical protein
MLPSEVTPVVYRALVLLALGAFVLPAQITVTLRGVVVDPAGARIPGTMVQVRNTATGVFTDAKSVASGFEFQNLAPGTYDLVVWPLPRFQGRKIEGVTVRAGEIRDLGRLPLEFEKATPTVIQGAELSALIQESRSLMSSRTVPLCVSLPNNPVLVFDGGGPHVLFPESEQPAVKPAESAKPSAR